MSIQTASVEVVSNERECHALITTPDGTADIRLDPVPFYNKQYIGTYTPKPESRPKKVSAKRQKRASIAQETEVMEELGGRRHPGSGALVGLKGDGRVRNKYRVEMKHTRQAGHRVDRKDLAKIRGECTGLEAPLFVIDFVDPQTGGSPDRWIMMPFETFKKLDQDAAAHDLRFTAAGR